jgi:hypothetical protein
MFDDSKSLEFNKKMYTTNVECAIVDIGTWCGSVTKKKLIKYTKQQTLCDDVGITRTCKKGLMFCVFIPLIFIIC